MTDLMTQIGSMKISVQTAPNGRCDVITTEPDGAGSSETHSIRLTSLQWSRLQSLLKAFWEIEEGD